MGHDIYAYIKEKNSEEKEEVAYFRISAFNYVRRKLFYGTLNNSESANAGVSGNGSTIQFTKDDIQTAKEACKYYLEDIDALYQFVLSKTNIEAEETIKKFRQLIAQVFNGNELEFSEALEDESNVEEIKENLVDIILFHHKVLEAYHDASRRNNIEIEIEFC
jgi:hypothetical protein